MVIYGDRNIVDLESKDIFLKDDCKVCGKQKKLWREFIDRYKDGREEKYIITYDCLIDTFGKDEADYVFENGNNSEEW